MIAIFTLLFTLSLSLLVTRIAAVALTLTGVSAEIARFQARSAFTGAGYTTHEAESIVNHPVRRKIISWLMVLGNLGMAGVVAGVIATFTSSSEDGVDLSFRVTLLIVGALIIWLISRSKLIDNAISKLIEWALLKWTNLDIRDYVSLLHLGKGYVVLELQVNQGDWIADKPLSESRLTSEGVLILGIHRQGGTYVGSPDGQTKIVANDVLTVYGPIERLEELDIRKTGFDGDRAHRIAVAAQKEAKEMVEKSQPEGSEE
jgi:hypothetical protein